MARVDGLDRLVRQLAVEPEVVRCDECRIVVVDTERLLVEGEVELRVPQSWQSLDRVVVS